MDIPYINSGVAPLQEPSNLNHATQNLMNNITLINPPLSLEERYGKAMAQFGAVTEPLGLAYIAGMLEKKDIPVTIIDAQAEELAVDQVGEVFHAARYKGSMGQSRLFLH